MVFMCWYFGEVMVVNECEIKVRKELPVRLIGRRGIFWLRVMRVDSSWLGRILTLVCAPSAVVVMNLLGSSFELIIE